MELVTVLEIAIRYGTVFDDMLIPNLASIGDCVTVNMLLDLKIRLICTWI